PWLSQQQDLSGLRIAYSANFGYVQVAPQIQALVAQAVQRLVRLGAQVEEVDPGFSDPLATFNTLWFAGAARLASALSDE
ncbi:amidase family protein, partial [Paraburkholderia sp. SIMBA_055]